MQINRAFGQALQRIRRAKGLTQEDFSLVSSRTYLSTLERGLKSPTLEKVQQISTRLGVNPLTLIGLTFALTSGDGKSPAFDTALQELKALFREQEVR